MAGELKTISCKEAWQIMQDDPRAYLVDIRSRLKMQLAVILQRLCCSRLIVQHRQRRVYRLVMTIRGMA